MLQGHGEVPRRSTTETDVGGQLELRQGWIGERRARGPREAEPKGGAAGECRVPQGLLLTSHLPELPCRDFCG